MDDFREQKLRISWDKENEQYGVSTEYGFNLSPGKNFEEVVDSVLARYQGHPIFELDFLPGSRENLSERAVFALEHLVNFCNKVGEVEKALKGEKQ